MIFYVIPVTFLMRLLMNEFTKTHISSWVIEFWMKSMPIIETKFGIFCILAVK